VSAISALQRLQYISSPPENGGMDTSSMNPVADFRRYILRRSVRQIHGLNLVRALILDFFELGLMSPMLKTS
jgi:hypothetical protein